MEMTVQSLYLDLLKKSLSFTLWPEPPVPVSHPMFGRRKKVRFAAYSAVDSILERFGLGLVRDRAVTDHQRENGEVWSTYADTMIGLKRLENLQNCVETVLRENIPGDFIETGVWRGGACIFMRGLLAANGVGDRKVYVADSFAGLPKPDTDAYPVDLGDKHFKQPFLAVSKEQVQANFRRYGLLDEQVVFLQGWFKDTLSKAPIEKLAILRLDGDMYSSTMETLDALYAKLSPGGFCIIDDWALHPCSTAVMDFRTAHGITEDILAIDTIAKFWRKL